MEKLLRDFRPDGSWRDIFVFDSALTDWDAFLSWVRSGERVFEFFVDGKPAALPSTAAGVFEIRETASPQLEVRIGEATARCHFFSEAGFELDVNPREFPTVESLEPLLDFLAGLGRLLHRIAMISLENAHDRVLARYEPELDQVVYVEAPRGE